MTLTHSLTPKLRVALYGHDTQGLGHLRRNLCIARLLDEQLSPRTLLCSGLADAHRFDLPDSVDLVTLPAIVKDGRGSYRARAASTGIDEILTLRSCVLTAALTAFEPDVLIVDKVALGVLGELEPALAALQAGGRCRIVLGLRDILDAPAVARSDWEVQQTTAAIRRFYDAVWVYGDPAIADPAADYHLPDDVAARLSFCGYLAAGRPRSRPDVDVAELIAGGPYALCLLGGGQDGDALGRAFLDAPLPAGLRRILLTGPLMPGDQRRALEDLAAGRSSSHVVRFVNEPSWLARSADVVVSMAGYNTVCELLDAGVPAVLVPRTHPRQEQQIRAQRFNELGVFGCLLPQHLDGRTLGRAITEALAAPRVSAAVDLWGAARLPGMVSALVQDLAQESPRAAV